MKASSVHTVSNKWGYRAEKDRMRALCDEICRRPGQLVESPAALDDESLHAACCSQSVFKQKCIGWAEKSGSMAC